MSTHFLSFLLFLSLSAALYSAAPEEQATPTMSNSLPPRESLRLFLAGTPITFDQIRAGGLRDVAVLVWACHSTQLPKEATDPEVVAAVRGWLERGGGLLLVGMAPAYAFHLGLEASPPQRVDFAETSGSIGIHRAADHPVFRGLVADASHPDWFFLSGSSFILLENGVWQQGVGFRGRCLGSYVRQWGRTVNDATDLAVLNEWTLGKGRILGYGNNLLLEEHWDNPHAVNLQPFLRNVVAYLSGDRSTAPVVAVLPETPSRLHADEKMSPPAPAEAQPHSLHRALPGLPYIAHFGWLGAVNYQRSRRNPPVDLNYFRKELIDEPWRWGANLLEFFPEDHGFRGFSLTWKKDDPIPRAATYLQSESFWPQWDWPEVRKVGEHAHQRDFLIHTFWHRRPAQSFGDAMDFTELVGRELQNPLLYGRAGSQDGFGVEGWFSDAEGETFSRIWPYNPGAYFHTTSVLPGRSPALSGSWMCALGRAPGAFMNGIANRWRYTQHPPLYLSYQADCRALRPSRKAAGWSSSFGGGSTPDWLMRELYDFCRDRLYLDTAVWWLGEPPATLPPCYRPYVYGLSADPLRAAVTTTLRATGMDGYRDQTARVSGGRIPPRWVGRVPFPQDTAILQNNHIRLLRLAAEDRGVVQYDPRRLADFDNMDADRRVVEISVDFLRCATPAGALEERKMGEVVWSLGNEDHSGAEFRPMGGYGNRCTTGADAASFPAKLGYEIDPTWPQEVCVLVQLEAGRYRLEVVALPVEATAIVHVRVDGELAGYYFPAPGETHYAVPFSVSRPGEHTLTLWVERAHEFPRSASPSLEQRIQKEVAHAFDAVRIRRVSASAATHVHAIPVGHTALLEETATFDPAGQVRQVRRYHVDSDSPILRVEVENTAPRPLAWENRINLRGYGAPRPVAGVHRVWRLSPRSEGLPPLVLLAQGEDIRTIESVGNEVVVRFAEKATSSGRIALIVADGLYGAGDDACLADLAFAPRPRLRLTPEQPVVHSNPWPAPRVEVVEIAHPAKGPYLVAETGGDGRTYWLARGAQPAGRVDYLKLYLPGGRSAKLQPCGFIQGIVKPGWGCQYALGIRDPVEARRCEVRVVKTGPFLFAPRIEWKQPFDAVWVNGKPWRYFDGNVVFLPNRPGDYDVRVEQTGHPAPSVARTFLDVEAAVWNPESRSLDLDLRTPHWWEGPLAGDRPYVLMVLSSTPPVRLEGKGEIIPWEQYRASPNALQKMRARGALLRLWPGKARVFFADAP